MAASASEAGRDAIASAIARTSEVRQVSAVHIATEQGGRLLIAARIGLSPALGLQEVATVIARVQLAVARLVPSGTAILIEPDVAADQTTPTEAIVIRGFD
jgi:divalent metal cation (Fe/Co/Zn/Cd) transporter